MNNMTSKGLTGNALKYIAIIAMLIDHIAWYFVPKLSLLGMTMHIIGRTTAPIMCFFIAEGYYHTKNVKKYALRLLIFIIIFYIPFFFPPVFKLYGGLPKNVLSTLLSGLLALWAWDKINNKILKVFVIILLCFISCFGNWGIFGVLFILSFGINKGNFKKQAIYFSIISVLMVVLWTYEAVLNGNSIFSQFFQLSVLLALPLLYFYNGKRGKGGQFNKWVFYIFYPLHLLILSLIYLQVEI